MDSHMFNILLSKKIKLKNKTPTSFLKLLEQKFKFHYYHNWCDFFYTLSKLKRDENELKPIEISRITYKTSGRDGKSSLQIPGWNWTLHSYRKSYTVLYKIIT